MTYRKRFAALGMSLVLTASFFTSCNVKKSLPSLKSEEKESEIQSEFDTYTDELFEEEVTLNTIALHYTLADPAAYGINDYEISFAKMGFLVSSSESCNKSSFRFCSTCFCKSLILSDEPVEYLTRYS